jgi:hypothetical protein
MDIVIGLIFEVLGDCVIELVGDMVTRVWLWVT